MFSGAPWSDRGAWWVAPSPSYDTLVALEVPDPDHESSEQPWTRTITGIAWQAFPR
jgi:hypothetical protein